MAKSLSMLNTIQGSQLERFYPRGWDLRRMDRCGALSLRQLVRPAKFWDDDFKAVPVEEIGTPMGDAIADVIESTRKQGRKLAIILPVGPVVMYKTVVARLRASGVKCDHVTTFNMDEWSDRHGNSMPGDQPGGFEYTMNRALFAPIGRRNTVSAGQRNFATKKNLPTYARKIVALRDEGAMLVTVYGIGRTCHIAFWEPHLADESRSANGRSRRTGSAWTCIR